jgi:chemotaxis protein methyltransferase CheR
MAFSSKRPMQKHDDSLDGCGSIRPLSHQEFEQIRRLAYEKFGLNLRDGKEELVSARLGKKIRESNFRSFREYYRHVINDASGEALAGLIDALATNHTSFLREPEHFDFLRKTILPVLRSRGSVEIWCAACSTGEEPYSIVFCLLEEQLARPAVRVLATDISTKALATAQKAIYPAERFDQFPSDWLHRYFLRGEGQWKGWFRVKTDVRDLVEFRRVNLIEPWGNVRPFPVIFCRNVMIYFDRPSQTRLVNRLAERLEPGGYLLIGHAESLSGIEHPLRYIRPAVYRKPRSGGQA